MQTAYIQVWEAPVNPRESRLRESLSYSYVVEGVFQNGPDGSGDDVEWTSQAAILSTEIESGIQLGSTEEAEG